ncbi:MAG TPA: hypothetical protein VMC05_01150 [Xanthobacteraceae bacterium]|nr:hypothetical protein [Xanthobacteraceae bacterium]
MQASPATGQQDAAWFVEPDHANAKLRQRKAAARRDDASSARAIIVSSIFLVLFASGLLFGGQAAIDPLLKMVKAADNTRQTGEVLMPTRDGKFCRHMTFDNATASVVEGDVELCPDNIAQGEFRSFGRGFSWGNR